MESLFNRLGRGRYCKSDTGRRFAYIWRSPVFDFTLRHATSIFRFHHAVVATAWVGKFCQRWRYGHAALGHRATLLTDGRVRLQVDRKMCANCTTLAPEAGRRGA
jgi:hypothetical protein